MTAAGTGVDATLSTTCRICGEGGTKKVLEIGHEGRAYTVVRCRRCGTIQTVEFHAPVSPDYVGLTESDIDDERLWCQGAHKVPAFRRWSAHARSLLARPLEGCRLLDAGCGTGGFLSFAQSLGLSVYGYDASRAQAEFAARTFASVRLANDPIGYLEALGERDLRFDIVTLWDVLEHVRQPFELLLQLRGVLRPGGLIFVSVPNASAMRWKAVVHRLRGLPKGFGWVPWEHVFYYSPASLALLHRNAGFVVERAGAVACYPRPLSAHEVLRRIGFAAMTLTPAIAPQVFLWSRTTA